MVIIAAPEDTKEVLGVDGKVIVLPPLMLRLLPERLKLGLGEEMVAEFTPLVTVSAPKTEMVWAIWEGITTVLPPLMLREFEFILSVGFGTESV